MKVQYFNLFLVVILSLAASCTALTSPLFEQDIENKFNLFKDKFDKKMQTLSWNTNAFGYHMGAGKQPDSSANSPSPAAITEPHPAAPAPEPHLPIKEAAPKPVAAPVPEPVSHETGTQAQAGAGTTTGEAASSAGTSARKNSPQHSGFGLKRLNWG